MKRLALLPAVLSWNIMEAPEAHINNHNRI